MNPLIVKIHQAHHIAKHLSEIYTDKSFKVVKHPDRKHRDWYGRIYMIEIRQRGEFVGYQQQF